MTLLEYNKSKELQQAVKDYAEQHGGSFFWQEPGGGFLYELKEKAFSPSADATVEQVIDDLKSGKQLSELWPEAENTDPDTLY